MLIDGSEYVRVDSVDASNDTVSIAERGLRRTTDDTRTSGSVIHYCPMRVREAIAAKAAEELVRYDSFVDSMLDDNDAVSPTRKIDDWEREYQDVVNRFSQWGYG